MVEQNENNIGDSERTRRETNRQIVGAIRRAINDSGASRWSIGQQKILRNGIFPALAALHELHPDWTVTDKDAQTELEMAADSERLERGLNVDLFAPTRKHLVREGVPGSSMTLVSVVFVDSLRSLRTGQTSRETRQSPEAGLAERNFLTRVSISQQIKEGWKERKKPTVSQLFTKHPR